MAKYTVTLTKIYNGSIVVEANSEAEAINYVKENMSDIVFDDNFSYGETTADFAEPVEG